MAVLGGFINNPKVKKVIDIASQIKKSVNNGTSGVPSPSVVSNTYGSSGPSRRNTPTIEKNMNTSTGQGVVTNPGAGITGETIENTLTPTETVTPTEQIDAEYYRNIANAQKQKKIAALDKSMRNSLSAVDEEEAKIKPMYYDKRNQEAAQSDLGALNFAQYMASKGLKGNAGTMPEMNRINALNANIGKLDRQETSDMSNIARRKSDITTGYEYDKAIAESEAEDEANRMWLDQLNRNREYNSEVEQYEDEKLANAKAEYASNIGRFEDYQAEINNVMNDGDTSNDWQLAYLQNARQQKIAGQNVAQLKAQEQAAAQEAAQQKAQEDSARKEIDAAMKLWQMYGKANQYISDILGVPVGASTAAYGQSVAKANNTSSASRSSAPSISKTEQRNQDFADDYRAIKGLSYADAIGELTNNKAAYISAYGLSGYNQLWNEALADAIREGAVQAR